MLELLKKWKKNIKEEITLQTFKKPNSTAEIEKFKN